MKNRELLLKISLLYCTVTWHISTQVDNYLELVLLDQLVQVH